MKADPEQIRKLLALKRYELPEEGYLEDFLFEFHRRRRILPEPSSPARSGRWWWAYAGGLAYAAAWSLIVLLPGDQKEQPKTIIPATYRPDHPVKKDSVRTADPVTSPELPEERREF